MVKPLNKFYVLKRGGRREEVHIDKITSRIQKLCYGLNTDYVDPVSITLKVVNGLYPGVTTAELDALAAETAATLSEDHPDYATLAARIAISNLQKETKKLFSDVIDDLYNVFDEKLGEKSPIISEELHKIITQNSERLNSCMIYDRDFSYDYFAFKELEKSYLLRINGKVVERPQHMLMRVAVGIHKENIDDAIKTYNLLSERFYIHSTNTLLLASTLKPQLCSSIVMMMPDDSIEGIFNCVRLCGLVSKYTGTVGLNIQNIRAKGTYIAGTNGVSNGLVPMLRVFNNMACYVDQLSTNKPSEIAVYIEPWHADILEFLNLSKPGGKEEVRTRDLSYALWVPDLFMKRVESNGKWSLMCPHQSPGLTNSYGDEFERLYEKYEKEGKYIKQIQAQELWRAIIVLQAETGGPVMMYKDVCNRKSNQKHIGTIRGGSYSGEVVAYTSDEEIVACPQASIAVNMFVSPDRKSFDFQKLKEVTKVVTKNLDKIIDVSFYPVPEEQKSNLNHRAIGIGVQGLADTFILMRMPCESEEARKLNKQIFETLYYGALEASSDLAELNGSYPMYKGSPVSKGVLQYDLWDVKPSDLWDWQTLKETIAKTGVRNSLLVSQMSTPILSRLFANSESTDLYRSFLYTRRVSSGEFPVVNPYLLRDLTEKDIWDDKVKEAIVSNAGSIQNIPEIPDDLKLIYKTTWEVSQKVVLNMAIDRGAFIDQSQSLNIHMMNPNYGSLSSMHFYGWNSGLKTGLNKLRTKSAPKVYSKLGDKQKIDVPAKEDDLEEMKRKQREEEEKNLASLVCSLQNREACDMCGA
ncbi:ribonucleoside-diphosphate reductase large subunit-like [Diabrotica undecimpunctata]|uniref:ribonucleoside-diphosphate reductase large subunit-like n=1 Tax=Diabrotica undecimpunctata TaxID=50387 RepID=UPI003B63F06C